MPNLPPYNPEYKFAMSFAHRRPAHHLGMPALTWHRAFWRPVEKPEPAWIEEIERLTLDFFDSACMARQKSGSNIAPSITNLQSIPSSDTRGVHELLRNSYAKSDAGTWISNSISERAGGLSRYETVQLEFAWNSLPITIRVEVFEEYFTLTNSVYLPPWRAETKATVVHGGR